MRVAALTTGRNDPSARFRIRQHIDPLASAGIQVHEFVPWIDKHAGVPSPITDRTPHFTRPALESMWRMAKLAARLPGIAGALAADVVWLNRELLPGRYTLERFIRRPVALDVDDAIWCALPDGERTMSRLAREAAIVIAGNRYIADWFSSYTNSIRIVPTAIDTDRFQPRDWDPSRSMHPFTVGWTGSRGNFGYLYAIEEPLRIFLEETDSRLLVIAESPPRFGRINDQRVSFREWNQTVEATALHDMDVGLMPLPDNRWTRGKCSFKMLQYMSAGLPVIVSPVGMNAEVLRLGAVGFAASTDEDWLEALRCIHRNPASARQLGANGRQIVLERYSRAVASRLLVDIFMGLA